jgi:ketosteroid isomerase-like protein
VLFVLSTSTTAQQAQTAKPAQQNPPSALTAADQEIVSASNRWFSAMLRNDAEQLRELEADDFQIVQLTPRGIMMMDRSAQFESIKRGAVDRSSVQRELSRVKIRRYEGTAILTALATLRNTSSSTPAAAPQGVITEVWTNRDGKWRIAHFQPMDVPSAPAAAPAPQR